MYRSRSRGRCPIQCHSEAEIFPYAVEHSTSSHTGEYHLGSDSCHREKWYASSGFGHSNVEGKC